jgi:dTDP-4-dehydrorhamnose reductase
LAAKRPAFLVLGAHGQLGQAFLSTLGRRAVGLNRSQLTLGDAPQTERVLRALRPRVVINCAACNQVDVAETSGHEQALAANARGPAQLAAQARRLDYRLVHFSTDYVFGADGLRRPRGEEDEPAPLNFYGYSKLLGEQAVLSTDPQSVVLRVAHLYGGRSLSPGRQNLAERFLKLARAGQPIAATRGQYLNPTYVGDVVAATLSLLEHKVSGLLHLTGEGECTAAEFAQAVCQAAGLRGTIREVAADPRPAPRPRYTVLANLRLARLGFPPLPHWQVSLAQHICASGSAQS